MDSPTSTHAFTDPAVAVTYALAGNATLTLQSERTGAHFTFRVSKPKETRDGRPVWFVKVREGAEFAYLGMIDGQRSFRRTAKSPILEGAPPAVAFRYFWDHVALGTMPAKLAVRHEGSCGRCGRPLTHPDSIEAGIGPECAKKKPPA